MDALAKNLWLLITIVIPGMFTYGVWRLLLLLSSSSKLASDVFSQVDSSTLITSSIIIGIALLQQSIGLLIEYILYLRARKKTDDSLFKKLFYRRFILITKEEESGNKNKVIANFFLTLNVLVGVKFLLVYFLFFERLSLIHWLSILLFFFGVILLFNLIFRYKTAIQVIEKD